MQPSLAYEKHNSIPVRDELARDGSANDGMEIITQRINPADLGTEVQLR